MEIIKSILNIVLPILITVLLTILIETILYFQKINTKLSDKIKNYLNTLNTIKLSIPHELQKIKVFNKLSPKFQKIIINQLKLEITNTIRESTDNYDKNLENKRTQILIVYFVLLFIFSAFIIICLIFFRNSINWFKLIIYTTFLTVLLIGVEFFFIKEVFPHLAVINGYEILFNIITSITNYLKK
jgi:hypothetical protein